MMKFDMDSHLKEVYARLVSFLSIQAFFIFLVFHVLDVALYDDPWVKYLGYMFFASALFAFLEVTLVNRGDVGTFAQVSLVLFIVYFVIGDTGFTLAYEPKHVIAIGIATEISVAMQLLIPPFKEQRAWVDKNGFWAHCMIFPKMLPWVMAYAYVLVMLLSTIVLGAERGILDFYLVTHSILYAISTGLCYRKDWKRLMCRD